MASLKLIATQFFWLQVWKAKILNCDNSYFKLRICIEGGTRCKNGPMRCCSVVTGATRIIEHIILMCLPGSEDKARVQSPCASYICSPHHVPQTDQVTEEGDRFRSALIFKEGMSFSSHKSQY